MLRRLYRPIAGSHNLYYHINDLNTEKKLSYIASYICNSDSIHIVVGLSLYTSTAYTHHGQL